MKSEDEISRALLNWKSVASLLGDRGDYQSDMAQGYVWALEWVLEDGKGEDLT